jgi:predicted nucleic acid-binding protein
MSGGKTFIDSNVFIYAVQTTDAAKSARCAGWLRYLVRSGCGAANLQVLNEIANVLIKRRMMTAAEIFAVADGYRIFGANPISTETVAAARLIHFDTDYSWWDCVLMASAIELQCRYFLTEDLKPQQSVRGLTIISPFLHSPPDSPFH